MGWRSSRSGTNPITSSVKVRDPSGYVVEVAYDPTAL